MTGAAPPPRTPPPHFEDFDIDATRVPWRIGILVADSTRRISRPAARDPRTQFFPGSDFPPARRIGPLRSALKLPE